nr:hypothetical protein Iba_chr13cCG8380 [Ipomoea batatas]
MEEILTVTACRTEGFSAKYLRIQDFPQDLSQLLPGFHGFVEERSWDVNRHRIVALLEGLNRVFGDAINILDGVLDGFRHECSENQLPELQMLGDLGLGPAPRSGHRGRDLGAGRGRDPGLGPALRSGGHDLGAGRGHDPGLGPAPRPRGRGRDLGAGRGRDPSLGPAPRLGGHDLGAGRGHDPGLFPAPRSGGRGRDLGAGPRLRSGCHDLGHRGPGT